MAPYYLLCCPSRLIHIHRCQRHFWTEAFHDAVPSRPATATTADVSGLRIQSNWSHLRQQNIQLQYRRQIQHFLDLIFVHLAALFDTRYTTASGPGTIHAFGWLTSKLVIKNRCPSRMSPGEPPSLNTMRMGSHRVICADRMGSLLRHRASLATTTRKSRTLRCGQMCYPCPCEYQDTCEDMSRTHLKFALDIIV